VAEIRLLHRRMYTCDLAVRFICCRGLSVSIVINA
jgi:hypothetical protein